MENLAGNKSKISQIDFLMTTVYCKKTKYFVMLKPKSFIRIVYNRLALSSVQYLSLWTKYGKACILKTLLVTSGSPLGLNIYFVI